MRTTLACTWEHASTSQRRMLQIITPCISARLPVRFPRAQVSLTIELQQREPAVTCMSLHPGNVYTGVTRRYPYLVRFLYGACQPLLRFVQPPVADGASTSVFAVATPHAQILRGSYLERSTPVEPAAAARDPELVQRLWHLSEELVAPWSEPLAM